MKRICYLFLAATLLANAVSAQNISRQAGDWLIRGGVGIVDPKSDNLSLGPSTNLQVDSAVALYLNGTYMITDAIGVELLASSPFEHDISVDGVGKVGSTKQLPPTLSLQWHTPAIGRVQPYLGVGVNWTLFFSESVDGGSLDLDDSFGIAAQAGIDFNLNENWFLNFDFRWVNIETDASIDGDSVGTVEIDPLVYALNVGYKF